MSEARIVVPTETWDRYVKAVEDLHYVVGVNHDPPRRAYCLGVLVWPDDEVPVGEIRYEGDVPQRARALFESMIGGETLVLPHR